MTSKGECNRLNLVKQDSDITLCIHCYSENSSNLSCSFHHRDFSVNKDDHKQRLAIQLQQDENTKDAHTMADLPRFVPKSKIIFLK